MNPGQDEPFPHPDDSTVPKPGADHQEGALRAICMLYFGATTLRDIVDKLHRSGCIPLSGKEIVSMLQRQNLLERMGAQLSDEERFLADQRGLGREWADISREVGGSPDALRKRLARAVDRAARGLGLEEVTDV
jgi:hypothetical protein